MASHTGVNNNISPFLKTPRACLVASHTIWPKLILKGQKSISPWCFDLTANRNGGSVRCRVNTQERNSACASLLVIGALAFVITTPSAAQGPCRNWAEGNTYNVGDSVRYNNATYTCLQTHTAHVGAVGTRLRPRHYGARADRVLAVLQRLRLIQLRRRHPRLIQLRRRHPRLIQVRDAAEFRHGPRPRSLPAVSARV